MRPFRLVPRLSSAVLSSAALMVSSGDVPSVSADTIELGGQVQVDGEIIRRTETGTKPHMIVQIDPELRIAVPLSRVRKTISDQDLSWYQSAAEQAGDDPEAHYQLARQCKAKGLLPQRDFHFQRVIELDPNHSKARYALDYALDGNEWVPYDQLQRQRGLILAEGKWQVPAVYARHKAQEDADAAAKVWIREFTRLRSVYLRNDKRSADALASIEAIEDPMASLAFAEALEESRGNSSDPRGLRKLYIRKLGSFHTSIAVQALVKAGLVETDNEIRTMALEELKEFGAASAVATYLPILTAENHSPTQVSAALRALTVFPDPELWETYVDALVTTHKSVGPAGPGMNVGRGSNGGMGLAMGGKPKVEFSQQQNPDALLLLQTIAPGVDFRFDQAQWRQYFANQLVGSPGDLRRDP